MVLWKYCGDVRDTGIGLQSKSDNVPSCPVQMAPLALLEGLLHAICGQYATKG